MQINKIHLTAASFIFALLASAEAATLTTWTFETAPPADLNNNVSITGIAADVGTGTASGLHASAATDWSTPVGNGSANSLSSNTWAIGDYYQFQTSTTGYDSISVGWDQTRSSTGPASFKLAYSTDGSSFTDVAGGSYSVVGGAAGSITYADTTTGTGWLGSLAAVNTSYGFSVAGVPELQDATTVYFRLIATATPGATGGTSRVDNFTVTGTAIPEPGAAAALAGLAALFGVIAKRRRLPLA